MNFQLENGSLYCWQWDIRQKIEVEGLEELNLTYPVFLIGNSKDKTGLYKIVPTQTEKWYISIPDEVLQKEGWGDVYLYDESTGTTKLTWRFTIKKKEKPQDYVYEPSEFVTLMELNLKVEEITQQLIPQLKEELKQYTSEEIEKAELDDIQLDKTLEKENHAADSKVVGQKLKEKVDKVQGKGLSTNDFTDDYKSKVESALQSFTEKDPTVPEWAKQPTKPSYSAQEVGALPSTTYIPSITGLASEVFVQNYVNNKGYMTYQQVYDVVDKATLPIIINLNELGLSLDLLFSGETIPISEEMTQDLADMWSSLKNILLIQQFEEVEAMVCHMYPSIAIDFSNGITEDSFVFESQIITELDGKSMSKFQLMVDSGSNTMTGKHILLTPVVSKQELDQALEEVFINE